MVYDPKSDNDRKAQFLKRLGADLQRLREASGLSQGRVSLVLTPDNENRDRMSKLELGKSGIDFHQYLELMWFFRSYGFEDHPGVLLAGLLLPEATKRSLEP